MQNSGELPRAPAGDRWRRLVSRYLLWGAGAALFSALVARATWGLGPDTPQVPLFDSDSAVPVLMCNAPGWSLYDAYYYGQDRFGAWPFLAARAVGRLLGLFCSERGLHAWLSAWLLGGMLVLGVLARRLGLLAAGVYAVAVLAPTPLRSLLFELAQVYPWQVPALLLGWWSLRRLLEPEHVHAGRAAAALGACALATWSSSVSGPLLVLLSGVELLRMRLLAQGRASARQVLRHGSRGLVAVGVSIALESLLRSAYHRHAQRLYGHGYRTRLRVDWGHLQENARTVLERVWEQPQLPLLGLGTVGALVAAVWLWRTQRGGGEREPALLEGAVLVLACWAVAAAHVPLLTVVEHVRENEHHPRYFVPLLLLGSLSGLLSLALGVGLLPGVARVRGWVLSGLGVQALAAAAWALPARVVSPEYVAQREVAERLARRLPGVALLGNYWETYVLAALPRQGAPMPVPADGQYQRTVWWQRELRQRAQVLVAHSRFPESGTAESPVPWLYQHETLLRLEQARWEEGGGRAFSLYRNVRGEVLAHTAEPAWKYWRPCTEGSSVVLRFEPRAQVHVAVVLGGELPGVEAVAEPLEAGGEALAPVELRAHGRLRVAHLEGAGVVLRGVRLRARVAPLSTLDRSACQAEAAFVVKGER